MNFEYQHEKYWNELIKITEERRERWKERWRELGSLIGTREWKYKLPEGDGEGASIDTVDTGMEADDESRDNRLPSPSAWVVVDDDSKSSFWGSLWGHHGSGSSSESYHETGDSVV